MLETLRRFRLAVVAFGCLSGPVLAHGGNYLGPPTGPPTTSLGPGGPSGPRGPGARTGGLAGLGGPTSWVQWWEFNKAPYLRLREAVHDPGIVEASDGQSTAQPKSLAPADSTKRDKILPALRKLADKESNRDIQTACLIAMAKIGVDHADFELLPFLKKRLTRGNQEIRETAAIALGLTRRQDAIPDLIDLARDTPAGRRLVKAESVDRRTRSFAIYGLGLVAERSLDLPTQKRVLSVLTEMLEVDDRDVQVAALLAMGLLNLDLSTAGHKRVLWQALETLWEFYGRTLGRTMERVQAHVPGTVARMLGRGSGPEHQRAKTMLAKELSQSKRRSPPIRQSAVLALGKLAVRREVHASDGYFSDLLIEQSKDGKDELARFLSLMALAEIGGATNRDALLAALKNGGKATEKPWAALALGVQAFHKRKAVGGTVDITVGRVLRQNLRNVKNDSFRGACAVALGLCGYADAVRDMRKILGRGSRMREVLRGYIAIGFALMDATETVPDLRKMVDDADHQPLLMMQSAIALGRLGDKKALDQLTDVLKRSSKNVARLSGIATAFRFIGDRRAVDRLMNLLENRDLTKLSRAFIAAALGGVSDANKLPWNSSYSIGTNYRAVVPTLTSGGTGILDIL